MSVNTYDATKKELINVGGGVRGTAVWTGTEAQYNALDKSKLQDGQIINITDDGNSIEKISDIVSLNGGDLLIKNKLWNIQMSDTGIHDNGDAPKDILTMLHFSDIHGNRDNLTRLSGFAQQYKDFIDVIVSTGDNVQYNFTNDFTFWTNDNYVKNNFLFCVGNHDLSAPSSVPTSQKQTDVPWSWDSAIATETAAYNKYYNSLIDNWGVNYSSGHCYFYKDMISEKDGVTHYKIRIIFVDIGHPTTEQVSWFESTLNDAKTNGFSVIVASHFEPAKHTSVPTPFCSREWGTQDSDYLNSSFVDKVKTFITSGGEFICWLSGHTHDDDFGRLETDPKQVDSNISTASDHNRSGDHIAKTGLRSQDCFNIMGFDTVDKVIKIMRVGRNYDRYMQCKDTMCYDYKNGKLLYPNHE